MMALKHVPLFTTILQVNNEMGSETMKRGGLPNSDILC